MDKLKIWEEQISKLDNLTLDEAKELYKEYEKETNSDKKIEIRNKLVNGLTHYVFDYVKNHWLDNEVSDLYDIDDIMAISIEYLIKYIEKGNLSNTNYPTNIFNGNYGRYLFNNLISLNEDNAPIIKKSDVELFNAFLDLKSKNKNLTFEQYRDYVLDNNIFKVEHIFPNYVYDHEILELFIPFNRIYDFLSKNGNEVNLNKKDFKLYKDLLYDELMMKEELKEDVSYNPDLSKNASNEELSQYLNKKLDLLKSEQMKKIIKIRFGLDDGIPRTLDEIAEILNTTRENVKHKEYIGITTLKSDESIKEFGKDYLELETNDNLEGKNKRI